MNDSIVNRKLKQLFGELDGKQIFRLARTDQVEFRRGTFVDVDPVSGAYLRTVTEVRLCRKYGYLETHYWVIEKLMPVSGPNAELLPGSKTSYEPIFVYRKPNNDPIPVSEDSVLSFVHVQLFGEKKKRDLEAEELAFYEAQVDYLTQFLSDECSPISILLATKHAVVNSKPEDKSDGRSDVSVVSSPRDSGVQAGSSSPARNDSSSTDE